MLTEVFGVNGFPLSLTYAPTLYRWPLPKPGAPAVGLNLEVPFGPFDLQWSPLLIQNILGESLAPLFSFGST